MGCGCGGKRRVSRSNVTSTTAPRPAVNASRVESAQTYQSATIRPAPTGPVSTTQRKTV